MIEQSRRTGPFGQSSGFGHGIGFGISFCGGHISILTVKRWEKREKILEKKTPIHCPTRISSGFCRKERGHFDAKPAFTKIRFQIYGNFRKCWKRLAFSLEACYDAQKGKGPRMRIDENATKAGRIFTVAALKKDSASRKVQIWPGIEERPNPVVLPAGSSAANQDSDLFVGKGI